jgi:predicted CXXCH cytochrome family protein
MRQPSNTQFNSVTLIRVAITIVALALLFGAAYFHLGEKQPDSRSTSVASSAMPPGPQPVAEYVGNAQCVSCHAEQAKEWASSHHAQSMAKAAPATVRGRFDGRTFQHQGVSSRFFRRGDAFFVHTDGPDGKMADFEIQYTFGIEPLQQYLIGMPGGRLQALGIAWDNQKMRWFHLRPHEKASAGDVLHWTGRYQTANTMCIVCHTTAFERRYDAVTDSFDSRWQEINVSCQACHGPGDTHVKWAQKGTSDQPQLAGLSRSGWPTGPLDGSKQPAQESCTPCHARRSELTALGVPGQALMDHYLPTLLKEGLYYADGQQREEVFVDGSYRQSKMFRMGVSCTNCHNPHTGKLRFQGNALCLQCHDQQKNPAFPSASGWYDAPEHHHHAAGSKGAQCVSCHMPATVYMGIQPRPDHSLRIPRPDVSLRTESPNACNGCHDKETTKWAADKVTQWYGSNRRRESHFGEAIASYRRGQGRDADLLIGLIKDSGVAPIVRATALDELRGASSAGTSARIAALSDPSAEVRVAAVASLATLEPQYRLQILGPLLSDPLRAVRLAAVLSLSTLARQQFEPEHRTTFDLAVQEYTAVQNLSLDMPGSRLNLAVMQDNMGKQDLAEQNYFAALKIDPDFSPARLNLAHLLARQRRISEAVVVLKEGLARSPGVGEMQYAMGLLQAQDGGGKSALGALKKAALLMPGRARVQYNLALAYQQSGQSKAAEDALKLAAQLDDRDPDVIYALAAFYFHAKQFKEARTWTERLAQVQPLEPRLSPLQRSLGLSVQ